MGIENMRRMYGVFTAGLLIIALISLLNSWSMEAVLRNRVVEISTQLQECSKQQTSCMEESLSLLEQRDSYMIKVKELDKQKLKASEDVQEYKNKLVKWETNFNSTQLDAETCKSELQSYKNVQVSVSATLEFLRLEKDTLTTQLTEKKKKIMELEKEVERLKLALTTKSVPNSSAPSKVTPVAQPPKISPPLNLPNPLNDVVDNDAKEDIEDNNGLNDGNDFDPHVQ